MSRLLIVVFFTPEIKNTPEIGRHLNFSLYFYKKYFCNMKEQLTDTLSSAELHA